MVRLTIREHIFAHELLLKIYRDEEPNEIAQDKMYFTLTRMYGQCNKIKYNSRLLKGFREKQI